MHGYHWRNTVEGAATLVGEISGMVTKYLESKLSFEELVISWSHAYTRNLGKRFSMSKGTEAGEQRTSLGIKTGWI